MEELNYLPFILLGAAVLLLAIFFYYVPFLLWISAKVSGVNISLIQLFLMRIRNVPPYVIARAMIEAHKAGLKSLNWKHTIWQADMLRKWFMHWYLPPRQI